eukprot:s354_g9.t5
MEILPGGASKNCGDRNDGLQGLPASCPGEIQEENDIERQDPANDDEPVTCTFLNDLRVAAEIEPGQGNGWQIIYPRAELKLAMDSVDVSLQVSVRLRDDTNVCGVCTAEPGATLRLSTSFEDFGGEAIQHFYGEEAAAKEESRVRKLRQKKFDQKLNAEVTQAILWKQTWAMISIFLCMLVVLAAMITCTVASFSLETELQGIGLAVALLVFCGCAGCGVSGLIAATGAAATQLRGSVQAERPELQRYQDEGVNGLNDYDDWRRDTAFSCFCCFPLVSLGCVVAVTIAFGLNEDGHLAAVLWGPVALLMCCGGIIGWRMEEDVSWRQRADNALVWAFICFFLWPLFLLSKCQCFAADILKPPKRSLDAAILTTRERTIVFEGNIIPKRETVCSWPGKYATAWDELVAGSRQDTISAAVVFLPEGSKHYGFHDPIPAKKDLCDLHGKCWCTPLYGEPKPWGCRWWSKWIANIEQAVSQECTLVVYYFNGMRGKGKVQDFTTAGKEHMRREAIFRCMDAFRKSDSFQDALEAGLKHLSEEQGPDSSSPYSREVHRLFLATLSEEDRQFLEASEGLGNSQKAEVAWLKRNGFRYIEKEVWELESSSPKVIGRATELQKLHRRSDGSSAEYRHPPKRGRCAVQKAVRQRGLY